MSLFGRFRRDQSGQVAIALAMMAVPIFGLAGAALDYTRAARARETLQTTTDAAALNAAAARFSGDRQRIALAQSFFPDANTPKGPAVAASINGRAVTVTAAISVKTSILGIIGISDMTVRVGATAVRTNDGPPICVLALDSTASGAVTVSGHASVAADGCAIHSNSSSANAIVVQGSASIRAAGLCSAGGVSASGAVTPPAQTYCDRVDDPFRNLPQAVSSGCDYTNVKIGPQEQRTLDPGIYCNGLDIKGKTTLRSGLYVIKNGPLSVSSQASVSGSGVTFYLTGSNAGFGLDGGGSIALSATTAGDYKGLLIVQDRNANAGATNLLNGGSDTVLTGAIYTPTQMLTVSGNGSFGQTSPFMPLVAGQVTFTGNSSTRIAAATVATPAPLPTFQNGARLSQ